VAVKVPAVEKVARGALTVDVAVAAVVVAVWPAVVAALKLYVLPL
jgi:hypothetical protein